jgi:hypothetical protein
MFKDSAHRQAAIDAWRAKRNANKTADTRAEGIRWFKKIAKRFASEAAAKAQNAEN